MSNSLTVLLGVIQKTSSAKPKNFWQRIRFFSDSQRSSYFAIARAWSHQVEKSTSPDFTPLDPEKDLNFLGLTGSHCSYSSSSSSLSWREVYTSSKVWRLALHSRPPIFSFHSFRAFCRSSSSMRQGPTQTTKYHNEKCTRNYKHRDVCLSRKWGVKTVAHTVTKEIRSTFAATAPLDTLTTVYSTMTKVNCTVLLNKVDYRKCGEI